MQWSRLGGYAAGKGLPAAFAFASVPVLLQLYGASAYGDYAQLWVIGVTVSGLGVGWLRQAELRFTSNEDISFSRLSRRFLLALISATGLVAVAVTPLVSPTVVKGPAPLLAVWFLTSVLALYSLRQVRAQRLFLVSAFTYAEIGRSAAGLIVAVALGLVGLQQASAIVAALSIGYLMAIHALPAMAQSRRPSGRMPMIKGEERELLGELFQYGWPMALWLGLSTLVLYMDRFLLAAHVSSEQLGEYAAASDLLIRGMSLLGAPILLHMHPVFMREYNSGNRKAAVVYARKWFLIIIVCVLACVSIGAVAIAAGFDLEGTERLGSSTLVLLIAGGGIWQAGLVAHKVLEAQNRTREMLIAMTASFGLEVLLLRVLVEPFGPLGAATSMVIAATTYTGYCVMRLFNVKEREGWV